MDPVPRRFRGKIRSRAPRGESAIISCVRLLPAVFSFLVGFVLHWQIARISREDNAAIANLKTETTFDPCTTGITRGVPTFKSRHDLGKVLEAEGLHIGAELGVQKAHYSNSLLSDWASNREYHLVDIWAKLENYNDHANKEQSEQDRIYAEAMENVKSWKSNIHVCRNFTTNCVRNYEDDYFDFIYVDARHDFKGVLQDLQLWWPKLKQGGIFAGHDYVSQDDGPSSGGQDWTLNYDGTRDETRLVVKGAVDQFAASVCRQVTVSYREKAWNSWAIRK
mmetsp:Transcript_34771/g.83150  ORF Transcript_34771/g.83150 Transcript_34771/m.83150 type:complete len:279 (-) Transcript_34771:82-918(-)